MKTTRTFKDTERYEFDTGECSYKNGFAQIDTQQDAPYYGIWTNPWTRETVTYCEGDITFETCESDEEYTELIRKIKAWHDESGWKFHGIDATSFESEMASKFKSIGLEDLLH